VETKKTWKDAFNSFGGEKLNFDSSDDSEEEDETEAQGGEVGEVAVLNTFI
jgi:hypothetical protein